MKQSIIFTVEQSSYEPSYEKLAILLARSIRKYDPSVDIHCGLFTNRMISDETRDSLERLNVNIHLDIRFDCKYNDVNYFLRNYCCHYFSNVNSLLSDNDRLLYLDIDVIALGKLDFDFPDKSVLVERVPDNIVEKERPYIGEIHHPLYYNWCSVVTEDNKHLFDLDYFANRYMKESDIIVSERINNGELNLVDQWVGAYYPKHSLSDNSLLFHYDSFIDSGSFYKLKEYDPQLYKEYYLYITEVLKLQINNDEDYWDGF